MQSLDTFTGLVVFALFFVGPAVAYFVLELGFFEPTPDEYFAKHPDKRLYVDGRGRTFVNIERLLKSPKVQEQIKACRRAVR